MASKSNLLLIALVVSIIANIALLAAPAKRPPQGKNAAQPAIWSVNKGQLENIMRALPEPKRKAIRSQMESEFAQLKAITDNTVKERNALSTLLAQPEMDANTVNAQLTKIREAQNASAEQAQRMILTVLSKLTVEERVAALGPKKAPQRPNANRPGPGQRKGPQAQPRQQQPPAAQPQR